MPTAKIYGDPVQKGSMKCVGGRGKVKHQLIDVNARRLDHDWTPKIVKAARKLLDRRDGFPYLGPLDVVLTITVDRPRTVPYREREWPITRNHGDIDKHIRSVLDALTVSELIRDDSLVVHVDVWQCYPDTWTCPGRLDRPGITLRVTEIPLAGPPPEGTLFGGDQ